MAISKEKKKDILNSLKDVVSKATAVVFVNFHKLTVARATELRKKLREEGVSYVVAKKTLARKAFEGSSVKGEIPNLDGELALAYLTEGDTVAPAREIQTFAKKFDGAVSILGGVFDGEFINKESMMEIAMIPPLQVLRAQFVNVINSPIQGLVIGLNAIAESKK